VLALAAVVPEACVRMRTLVEERCLDEARALQSRLAPLARLVGTQFGVPGLKAAMDLAGYEGGHPRPPLAPVNDEVRNLLRRQLDAFASADLLTDTAR